MRNSVIGSMREDKEQMDALMQRALDVAAQAMPGGDSDGQELLVSGERRLLDFSADTSVVKSLFEAISKKAGCLPCSISALKAPEYNCSSAKSPATARERHVFSDVVLSSKQ